MEINNYIRENYEEWTLDGMMHRDEPFPAAFDYSDNSCFWYQDDEYIRDNSHLRDDNLYSQKNIGRTLFKKTQRGTNVS